MPIGCFNVSLNMVWLNLKFRSKCMKPFADWRYLTTTTTKLCFFAISASVEKKIVVGHPK